MNKIKFLLLSITFLFLLTSVCLASDISYTFSSTAKFSTIIEPTIHHTDIKQVSSVDKNLNAKFNVSFGTYDIATAKINYKEDSGAITSTYEINISNQKDAFISIDSQANTKIDYQIEINFHNGDGAVTKTAYYPTESSFVSVNVSSVVEETVTPSQTKTITLESGNQEYANTSIYIPSGSLASTTNIKLEQLEPESNAPSVTKITPTTPMVALYSVTSDPEVEILTPITISLSYGTDTTATKFDLLYRQTSTDDWENVTIKSTDTKLKVISADILKFGEYAIYVSANLSSKDYRPSRRTIIKSRIGTNYPGFEFKYLKEGDKVSIFNLSGKRIREITSGSSEGFVWDGKKDDGDWAKSGIYIYQIKVDGKTISGTIVFVK